MTTTRRTPDASSTRPANPRFVDTPRQVLIRPRRTSTIDLAARGTVAVVRPGMPTLFRVLLAMTGVRV